jgi:hypothetical protein
MELDRFISETLQSVFKGIADAQEKLGALDGAINPKAYSWGEEQAKHLQVARDNRKIECVEFEVVLTLETGKGEGADAKIGVFSGLFGAGAGVRVDIKESAQSLNKIRFGIPVVWPTQKGW